MPHNLKLALYGILGLLVLGTVIIGLKKWLKPGPGDRELWLRMRSWWIMAGLFVTAIAVDRALSIVFFALVSFLALKEYFSIIPTRRADRRVLFWAYAAIPVQYFWVYDAWFGMFIIFIPVYLFLFIPL
ncbi:MAG: phosphatidate cytidylyltransferase, partial [Hydrogenophilaceae bacterium]|nr:phosphatidate cytidylyltransferase [Hydrogenophilaceae bacterium]